MENGRAAYATFRVKRFERAWCSNVSVLRTDSMADTLDGQLLRKREPSVVTISLVVAPHASRRLFSLSYTFPRIHIYTGTPILRVF